MNPEQIEQIKAILEFEYYGVTILHVSVLLFLVFAGAFLYSGRDQRSFAGRFLDLLVVLLCISLLVGCIVAGARIGNSYGYMGGGVAGGVFAFWFVFNLISRIRTARRNRMEREQLAKRLGIDRQ